jgi:UDP-GlcNAc:undecaprenyl-phosphate GlcNAc-1-phosphate transferase
VGLYRNLWRYVTISDIATVVRGVFFGTVGSALLISIFVREGFPYSTLAIYASLSLLCTAGVRLGLKTLRYHFALKWREGQRRVLIVGAGDAGELAVREMLNNRALQLQPVGFLDDDPGKRSACIHGVRVLGTRSDLLQTVQN